MRRPTFSVSFATAYLVVYLLLFKSNADRDIIFGMFLFSPVVVGWMLYTVLKYGKYEGPELNADEEWGYQDKNKDSLGTF
jgi:hypothetical protein